MTAEGPSPALRRAAGAFACGHCGNISAAREAAVCRACERTYCVDCAARGVSGCARPRPWRWRFHRRGEPLQVDASGRYLSYLVGASVRVADLGSARSQLFRAYHSSSTRARLRDGDREPRHAVLANGQVLSVGSALVTTESWSWSTSLPRQLDGLSDAAGEMLGALSTMQSDRLGRRAVAVSPHAQASQLVRDFYGGVDHRATRLATIGLFDSDKRRVVRCVSTLRPDRPMACAADDRAVFVRADEPELLLCSSLPWDVEAPSRREQMPVVEPQPVGWLHGKILWVGIAGRSIVALVREKGGDIETPSFLRCALFERGAWQMFSRRVGLQWLDVRCSLDASLSDDAALLAYRATPRRVIVRRVSLAGQAFEAPEVASIELDEDIRIVRFVDDDQRLLLITRGVAYAYYLRARNVLLGEPVRSEPWEALARSAAAR